jgi:signal transduction histidine kinase
VIADRRFDAQQTRLLADVAAAVAWSPDAHAALRRVAELIVPRLADWCAIDVREGETTFRRLAVVHADPRRQSSVHSLLGPWTLDPRRRGVASVVRTGERQVETDGAGPGALVPRTDPDAERLVSELGVTGYVSVPLPARAQPLGALTLVTAEPGRCFRDGDVALAETLARVAALAVANARLDGALADTSRRQDDLLAALSHQLRTPLTAMLAWLRLARHATEALERTRALETVERNGLVLGRFVDELMETARILVRRVSIVRRPVDLAAIIEQAVAGQVPAARAKGVRLDTDLDPACARYLGDRERLVQVVTVLVANAVKFTPPGGRIVARLDGDVVHARIRVTDSGRGISAELLPYVFELFHRAADEPGGEGLGLGLTMARGLVELHGGLVEAASEGPDRGATFTVLLPRAVSAPTRRPPSV